VRRRQGLSLEKVAARAALHRTEVGLLERSRRTCRIDTLIQLAGAMGVAPGDLLDGIDWIPAPEPRGTFAVRRGSISGRQVRTEPTK
jgi:transcriptional regulator with XRE-family HTH domain